MNDLVYVYVDETNASLK